MTQWQSACLTCKGWVLPSTLKKKCIIISWGDPGQPHFPECWEEGRRGLWEQMEFSTWSLCALRPSNQISHVTVRWLQVTDPWLRRSQAPRDSTWSLWGTWSLVGQRFSPSCWMNYHHYTWPEFRKASSNRAWEENKHAFVIKTVVLFCFLIGLDLLFLVKA